MKARLKNRIPGFGRDKFGTVKARRNQHEELAIGESYSNLLRANWNVKRALQKSVGKQVGLLRQPCFRGPRIFKY